MTSLAVALSIDSRGPSAMYIVTDSRVTWETKSQRWDAGQKAFAPTNSPDIFGYCGDAYFPPLALRQMIDLVNAGIIFRRSDSAEDRHRRALEVIRSAIEKESHAPVANFSVFHGARDGEFMSSKFSAWKTQYSSQTGEWNDRILDLSSGQSYLAHIDGSGTALVSQHTDQLQRTSAKRTSRGAIAAFFKALYSEEDALSGGPPQLVGIWRKGDAAKELHGQVISSESCLSYRALHDTPLAPSTTFSDHNFQVQTHSTSTIRNTANLRQISSPPTVPTTRSSSSSSTFPSHSRRIMSTT